MLQKVYIIILNYNNYDDTIECLESVFRINYGNYQVIVIDNASTNDSMANILSWTEGNSHFKPVKENRVLAQWTKHLTKPVKFTFLSEKDLVTKNYGASIHESQAIFIESSHNGGFAAGNNIDIRLAPGFNPEAATS